LAGKAGVNWEEVIEYLSRFGYRRNVLFVAVANDSPCEKRLGKKIPLPSRSRPPKLAGYIRDVSSG
jgi:hypothetical protein